MIKGFLLDFDGVITAPSPDHTTQLLAQALGVSQEKSQELFTAFWPKYVRGQVDEAELWETAKAETGKEVAMEHRNIWLGWAQLQPLPEMRALVKRLQASGYTVGLLTNITTLAEADVRAHGGYEGFDFLVQSCHVGLAKPEPAIYQLAMSHFSDAEPGEIVFVDDREKNLVPARKMGMRTILATSPQQVIADITRVAEL